MARQTWDLIAAEKEGINIKLGRYRGEGMLTLVRVNKDGAESGKGFAGVRIELVIDLEHEADS